MKEKLQAELVVIAHKILKLGKEANISKLKEVSKDIFEKLSVLDFIDNKFSELRPTLNSGLDEKDVIEKELEFVDTKETEAVELEEEKEITLTFDLDENIEEENIIPAENKFIKKTKEQENTFSNPFLNKEEVQNSKEERIEEINTEPENTESIFKNKDYKIFKSPNRFELKKEKDLNPEENKSTLKKELGEIVSEKEYDEAFKKFTAPAKSETENDNSVNVAYTRKQAFSIDLNDRIAFLRHLFKGDLEILNRTISKINTFKTFKDAKDHVLNEVKPNYDWSNKDEYQERLLKLIEAKFT